MTVAEEEKTAEELTSDIAKAMLRAVETNIPKQILKNNLWISKKTLINKRKKLKKCRG